MEKVALITGGTKGLGKAIGMEFSRSGATVFLTHRWASVDANDLIAEFTTQGLAAPHILECDVSDRAAIDHCLGTIKEIAGRLDILISNVALAKATRSLDDLKRRALEWSLSYSAWPLVEHIQATHQVFAAYPKYVIGVSSDGGEICHPGYDLAGASKAVLETLCRYLAIHLRPFGTRVNAIRPGLLDTESLRATFGEEVVAAIRQQNPDQLLDPAGVAQVCVALCSGLMDSVTGQVIVVDEGWSLVSPITYATQQAREPLPNG
jgi:NAD(P)-dependent dehydrogenase (short-subunit alcohol dehydrogenase family)